MKIDEALLQINGTDMWARPVSWRGKHMAYRLGNNGETTMIVPCQDGKGHAHMTSQTSELTEDWELVTPEDVENGL